MDSRHYRKGNSQADGQEDWEYEEYDDLNQLIEHYRRRSENSEETGYQKRRSQEDRYSEDRYQENHYQKDRYHKNRYRENPYQENRYQEDFDPEDAYDDSDEEDPEEEEDDYARQYFEREKRNLRRSENQKIREKQLKNKKRGAIIGVIAAAVVVFLLAANFASSKEEANAEDSVELTSTVSEETTEETVEDAESGNGEEEAVLLTSAEEVEEEEEEAEPLYAYYETDSTLMMGASETDISIYDAQRHISSSSGETYGDEGDSESSDDGSSAALAEDYVDSQYVILIDADTSEIIAERNAYDKIVPASMTKVMTLLVAVEQMEDPEDAMEDTFTVTQEICDEAYLSGSSFVGYGVGDVATVEDLLYGTILPSGADAAMALAEYTAGTQDAFVELMNEKAQELGISDTTHFSNVIGLYDDYNNYSTPYDMCVIMNAAIDNDLCREILSTRTWTTQAIMNNPDGTEISNWFLRRIEDHVSNAELICGKTGYVSESGNCAVSYMEKTDGSRYIACTALTYSSWRCIYDHAALYDYYAE